MAQKEVSRSSTLSTVNSEANPEEKLFFEGKYEECLDFIRHSLPKISEYDTNKKQNFIILGAQCLYEMGKGNEMKSFFETCYNRKLLLLPPTVFFVWMNYLFHINEYEKAIDLLIEFKSKGKPMSNDENNAYIKLMVYDGYVTHRKYKKAIKFLKKQHRLDSTYRNTLIDDVKLKMKNDPYGIVDEDDEKDLTDDDIDDDNKDDDEKKQTQETETKQLQIAKKKQTIWTNMRDNLYFMVNTLKEKTDRKMVIKTMFYLFLCWVILWMLKKNRQKINKYVSEIRDILIMSVGKSRISMN